MPTTTARTAPTDPVRRPAAVAEPIDLLGVAGGRVVNRVALPAGVLAILLLWVLLRRRR